MFCQNCGKEVGETDRFCPNCGVIIGYTNDRGKSAEQEPAASKPDDSHASFDQQLQPSSSKKAVTGILVGVVAAIGVITLLILLFVFAAVRGRASQQLDQWKDQLRDGNERYFDLDRGDDLDDYPDNELDDWDNDYDFNEIF